MTEDDFNQHVSNINYARCVLSENRNGLKPAARGLIAHKAIESWLAIGDIFGVSNALQKRLAFLDGLDLEQPVAPAPVADVLVSQAAPVLDGLAETPLDSVEFTSGLYAATKMIVNALAEKR